MKYLVGVLHFLLWIALVSSHDIARRCHRCPDGWVGHRRSCYFFSRDTFPMPVASEVCRNMKGDLVEINTSHENQYIRGQIKHRKLSYAFIGANDMREEHIWRWYGNDRMVHYTNWNPGEPNTPSYNCAFMHNYNGKWYDDSCSHRRYFVCEQRKRDGCAEIDEEQKTVMRLTSE